MLTFEERISSHTGPCLDITLGYDDRQKSRLRVRLPDGREAGIILQRGSSLRDGDLLRADDGSVLRVQAAAEPVASVNSSDKLLLARACYHLGNRHVPLQIDAGGIRFRRDHVLEHMLQHLGLQPRHEVATFEPEIGAYGRHEH